MTRLRHQTKLDRDCELVVRPVTDDVLAGHCDGARGWSARRKATRFYRRGYWDGRRWREHQWLATFGEGAAD